MKALSLRQPWAWLVVHGGKNIENRHWNTRFRGEFLIHASKGMTRAEYESARMFTNDVLGPDAISVLTRMPSIDKIDRGGLVGSAKVVNVISPCMVADDASKLALAGALPCRCGNRWHMGEQFGFVLADVQPIKFRPLKGELQFFEVDKK